MRARSGLRLVLAVVETHVLQRSRARESAEWELCGGHRVRPVGLQRSRARESAEWAGGLVGDGGLRHHFNGAALVRARSGTLLGSRSIRCTELQRSRARESAEWPAPMTLMRSAACFNGAALVRARSGRPGSPSSRATTRFNGAALVRARSGPRAKVFSSGKRCFNGAALVRARSGRLPPLVMRVRPALQRSRARESAEWADAQDDDLADLHASTEPRS